MCLRTDTDPYFLVELLRSGGTRRLLSLASYGLAYGFGSLFSALLRGFFYG